MEGGELEKQGKSRPHHAGTPATGRTLHARNVDPLHKKSSQKKQALPSRNPHNDSHNPFVVHSEKPSPQGAQEPLPCTEDTHPGAKTRPGASCGARRGLLAGSVHGLLAHGEAQAALTNRDCGAMVPPWSGVVPIAARRGVPSRMSLLRASLPPMELAGLYITNPEKALAAYSLGCTCIA